MNLKMKLLKPNNSIFVGFTMNLKLKIIRLDEENDKINKK